MIVDAPLPPVPAGVDDTAWAAAISAIRGYCQWHIAPNLPETVTVDGSGASVQLLPTLHLTALTSVTSDGIAPDDLADVQWSQMGALKVSGCWSAKYRGVVAEIVHGFDFFPQEVLAVARSLAQAPGSPALALTSGPHSVQLSPAGQAGPSALQDLHKDVLERYRVRVRP